MPYAPPSPTYTFNYLDSNATYTWGDSSSIQTTQTFPIYVPMTPQAVYTEPPKEIDDSPLTWLRREVEEICDLATVA